MLAARLKRLEKLARRRATLHPEGQVVAFTDEAYETLRRNLAARFGMSVEEFRAAVHATRARQAAEMQVGVTGTRGGDLAPDARARP